MEKVLVVGAGFMGSGIAQVSAQSGYQVYLMDIQPAITDRALRDIRWSVEKLEAKGLLREPSQKVLARISPEKDLSNASEVDWVIEAALEEEGLKRNIFQELDRISRPKTPLATNTSSIPITRLAENTKRPERVLGSAFLRACAADGIGRSGQRREDFPGNLRAGNSLCSISGKNSGSRSA